MCIRCEEKEAKAKGIEFGVTEIVASKRRDIDGIRKLISDERLKDSPDERWIGILEGGIERQEVVIASMLDGSFDPKLF